MPGELLRVHMPVLGECRAQLLDPGDELQLRLLRLFVRQLIFPQLVLFILRDVLLPDVP